MPPGVMVAWTVPLSANAAGKPLGACAEPTTRTPSIVTVPLDASIQPMSPKSMRRRTMPATLALPCRTMPWPTAAMPGVSARSATPAGTAIGAGCVVPL